MGLNSGSVLRSLSALVLMTKRSLNLIVELNCENFIYCEQWIVWD